jgi:hypothetical protein
MIVATIVATNIVMISGHITFQLPWNKRAMCVFTLMYTFDKCKEMMKLMEVKAWALESELFRQF